VGFYQFPPLPSPYEGETSPPLEEYYKYVPILPIFQCPTLPCLGGWEKINKEYYNQAKHKQQKIYSREYSGKAYHGK
jgi:hypothetical protein